MYYRFFGQRNPEKDIERILVDLQGSGGVCYVIPLAEGWKIISGTDSRYMEHGENTIFSEDEGLHTIAATSNDNFLHGYGHELAGHADYNYVFGWNHELTDMDFSLVFGNGVVFDDASGSPYDGSLRFGYMHTLAGDNHVTIFRGTNQDVVTDTWATFKYFPVPVDTVWYFHAKIVILTQGVAQTEIFAVEGAIKNDGGTTTILSSTTTNVHRDTATAECQAVADDGNDYLAFQLRETGANNYTYRMHFRVDTSELTFPA